MVELTRCPKCATLYDLEGINLSASGGWVQCGECDRKFKAESYQIDKNEVSFQANEPQFTVPSSTVIEDVARQRDYDENIPRAQLTDVLENKESEFSEKTITMGGESFGGTDSRDDFYKGFGTEIFDPNLIDETDENLISESEQLMKMDNHRQFKNAFEQHISEFEEEEIILRPSSPRKTALEEELELNAFAQQNKKKTPFLIKILGSLIALIVALSLLAVLAFQLHSRGTFTIFPDEQYSQLLNTIPYLKQFEKSQTNLSSLHLESTRMEKNADGLSIVLQLVNRSPVNQAYPDFQLEFTNFKGEVIARRIILPNMYLEKGYLGLLEAREAKTVFLNLLSLPQGSVGYQIKVVQQAS